MSREEKQIPNHDRYFVMCPDVVCDFRLNWLAAWVSFGVTYGFARLGGASEMTSLYIGVGFAVGAPVLLFCCILPWYNSRRSNNNVTPFSSIAITANPRGLNAIVGADQSDSEESAKSETKSDTEISSLSH